MPREKPTNAETVIAVAVTVALFAAICWVVMATRPDDTPTVNYQHFDGPGVAKVASGWVVKAVE